MRRTHLIPNPRYNRNERTRLQCGDGIYTIVFNWSPDHLANFDTFLNRHAMNTSSEQVVYEVCTTTPYIVERYNDIVKQVNAMNRCCREMIGDESKIVEFRELKKTRKKLVESLLSIFKKVEKKCETNNISYKFIQSF